MTILSLMNINYSINLTYIDFSIKNNEGNTSNFYIADIFATYKISSRFMIDFQLSNLFNVKEYT